MNYELRTDHAAYVTLNSHIVQGHPKSQSLRLQCHPSCSQEGQLGDLLLTSLETCLNIWKVVLRNLTCNPLHLYFPT